jgi:hypothetical protein
MKKEVYAKVTEYIDAIAQNLGVAAEYVYEVLVRQQIAEGIADTFIGLLFLALFTGSLSVLVKAYTKAEYERSEGRYSWMESPSNFYAFVKEFIEGTDGFFYAFYIPIQIGFFIFGLTSLYFGVLALINPEYYAIKDILDAFGGGN